MTDESSHSRRIDMLADEFLTRRRNREHPTIKESEPALPRSIDPYIPIDLETIIGPNLSLIL